MKQQYYFPAETLVSTIEPKLKNVLWIYPLEDHYELRLYNKKWKTLFSTKDTGLSDLSEAQVLQLNNELKNEIIQLLQKQVNRLSNDILLLTNKNLELERRIKKLEK